MSRDLPQPSGQRTPAASLVRASTCGHSRTECCGAKGSLRVRGWQMVPHGGLQQPVSVPESSAVSGPTLPWEKAGRRTHQL